MEQKRNIKRCRLEKEGYVALKKGAGSERETLYLEAHPNMVGSDEEGYSLRMRSKAGVELGMKLSAAEYGGLLVDLARQLEAMEAGRAVAEE